MEEETRQALQTLARENEALRETISANHRFVTGLVAGQVEVLKLLQEHYQVLTDVLYATLEALSTTKALPPQELELLAMKAQLTSERRRSLLRSVPVPEGAEPPPKAD